MNAPAKAGRPKSPEKAASILHAASELFLEMGFKSTPMDAVAKKAGVSKQTVYGHFANKEDLFRACIESKLAGYGFDEAFVLPDEDLRLALYTLAHRFVELLSDKDVIAMHRVIMGESAAQPRLAELFYTSGPARTRIMVRNYLERQVEAGRLGIPQERLHYATVQLLNTAFGEYQLKLMLGLIDRVEEDELAVHLGRVVEDFLTLYEVRAQV